MPDLLVSLTREELSSCSQAATLRGQINRACGIINARQDEDRDSHELEYLGIRAELAVAKAYGANFNPYNLGVDTGADFYIGDMAIDVKATFHREGRLLFRSKDHFKADIAVLVAATHEENRLRVVGWKTRNTYLKYAKVKDLAGKRTLAMDADDLGMPEALWLYLKNMEYR